MKKEMITLILISIILIVIFLSYTNLQNKQIKQIKTISENKEELDNDSTFIFTNSFLDSSFILLEEVKYDYIRNYSPISDSMHTVIANAYSNLIDIKIIEENLNRTNKDKVKADSLFDDFQNTIDTMLFLNEHKL